MLDLAGKKITCEITLKVSKCFLSVSVLHLLYGDSQLRGRHCPSSSTSLDGLCAEVGKEKDNSLDC